MYIDYLTLMLINLTAGLTIMAAWVQFDGEAPTARRWVPGFLMSGSVAFITGLHMVFTWPLPGSFNIIFGEMSVLFGVLLLGLAYVVAMGLDLLPIAIYATFVGIAAFIIGGQVINLEMTKNPALSGIAFLWMGLIGVFSLPMMAFRKAPIYRTFATIGLLIAALLWAIVGYAAYWDHLKPFSSWKPVSFKYEMDMQQPAPAAAPAAK